MKQILKNVRANAKNLLALKPAAKREIITQIATSLRENSQKILLANEKDLAAFKKGVAMKDRLKLDTLRLEKLCESLENIALLKDPVGKVLDGWVNEAGLSISKVAVPLGVVCVIYEARPAISAELIALLLKSSNCGVLKGGSEAANTNIAIFECIKSVLNSYGLDSCYLMFFERDELNQLLKMNEFIDVIVPRGSEAMIKSISARTKIPVIKHDKGLCHIFVDESADIKASVPIIINAKCQRPSVCNAVETLLVHKNAAKALFKELVPELKRHKVRIYGCVKTLKLLKESNLELFKATQKSYATEWLDYILNIKIVANIDEAMAHIEAFSSKHSEAILTNDLANANAFTAGISSACVFINASTRFCDGGEFGFGAEVGIATSKLHARGPMGLNELCTYKYIVQGNGEIRL